ncbi:MAG: hypothetical protein R2797_12490 [Gelidibacter sp.]
MIFQQLIISALLLWSCDTGKLKVVADIPNHLKEVSAAEITSTSDLIWVIEDAGNDNHLYGLDNKGNIKKDLIVLNSENKDWEDLTSDDEGNIYIGDFGNNSKKRENFTIYKIANPENAKDKVSAEAINFKLPKGKKSEDFEAFFMYKDSFYIFSKESKNCVMLKIPNTLGDHTAELAKEFNLDGKKNLITSADISDNGKTVVLLNHDKVWKLTNFESDDFFGGKIEALPFDFTSQMEGVCFKDSSTLYLTDESNGAEGSNLYKFVMN